MSKDVIVVDSFKPEDNDNHGILQLQELEEATDILRDVGNQVYGMVRSDGDLNVYAHIMNKFAEMCTTDELVNIERIFLSVEPDIYNKNDVVQKILISSVLLRKFYIMKHVNTNFNIFNMIGGVKYELPNEAWLEIMLKHTVPLLVNNNILN